MSDATAIAALVTDPIKGPRYVASLPEHTGKGRVVIRHTSAWAHATSLMAVAAYDIDINRAVRHFDLSGNELRLPQEQMSVPGTP